jgi:hypothetical protein
MTNAPALRVSVPDDSLRSAISDLPGDVEVIDWTMEGPAPVDEIDIVVPPDFGGPAVLAQLTTV